MSKSNSKGMLTLFKFRSLGDDESLKHAKEILETGRFWCSRLWEQNDPMEGVFRFGQGKLSPNDLKKLFHMKNNRFICSFSGARAFKRPLMWGYYANGFRGIAVKLEVAKSDVRGVSYVAQGVNWTPSSKNETTSTWLERVLTTKLKCWKHEDEYRYITKEEGGARVIGAISEVYFGWPYKAVINFEEVKAESKALREYDARVAELIDIAKKSKFRCFRAYVKEGKVTSSPLN